VKLDNGKEIGVNRLVACSTDPSRLLLKLIGEEHLEPRIVTSIKKLE